MRWTLFVFVLLGGISSQSFSQVRTLVKRTIDINQVLGQGNSNSIQIGKFISGDDELNEMYESTEKGPYWENRWFGATLVTVDSLFLESDDYEFRLDTYSNRLQYRRVESSADPLFVREYYISSYVTAEDNREFQLIRHGDKTPYVEILTKGEYTLAKLITSKIVSFEKAGPAYDGKEHRKFDKDEYLLFSFDGRNFEEVNGKAKSFVKSYPEFKKRYGEFEKSDKSNVSKDQLLLEFVKWMNRI